ncbi:unnamed protein product [Closterium sp. NIES-54]
MALRLVSRPFHVALVLAAVASLTVTARRTEVVSISFGGGSGSTSASPPSRTGSNSTTNGKAASASPIKLGYLCHCRPHGCWFRLAACMIDGTRAIAGKTTTVIRTNMVARLKLLLSECLWCLSVSGLHRPAPWMMEPTWFLKATYH